MRILNVDVPQDLSTRWRGLVGPEWQPFLVEPEDGFTTPRIAPDITAWEASGWRTLSDDLRDTFKAWRVQGASRVAWFDEASFMAMPRADRARLVRSQVDRRRGVVPTVRRWAQGFDVSVLRSQADGHRFVWWPSLLAQDPDPVLVDLVEDCQLLTRHEEVPADTWNACRELLPHAEEIVGTFPPSSGPNCFRTVLAAAGKADPSEWVLQDRFEHWLKTSCAPGGDDDHPGTVLVWRDRDRLPVHAAVTIGDGWAIEKPAQTWWTVRGVHQVRELIKANRSRGQRLERLRIANIGILSMLRALRRRRTPVDVPGLRWRDVAVAVPLASKTPPGLRRAVLLAMWDDENAAAAFADTYPLAERFAPNGFHAVLRPLRAFGTWPGLPDDVPRMRVTHHDGPVIVTTLGRLRMSQSPRFLRASRPAERAAIKADGFVWGTAATRPAGAPFMTTVSVWSSDEAAAAYAYADARAGHPKAMERQRRKDFHHESAFIRYAIVATSGTLPGVPPLDSAARPE